MAEVKFNAFGFAYLDVGFKPRRSQTMKAIRYKVDSGANCTTIAHEQLSLLGYDDWIRSGKQLVGDERPTLASGEPIDSCYMVVLPEINIGGCVGYNWPFLTSPIVKFRFLLGTDTMQFFNWEFDYEDGVCRFELIPDKRKLLFDQKEQSIHSLDIKKSQ